MNQHRRKDILHPQRGGEVNAFSHFRRGLADAQAQAVVGQGLPRRFQCTQQRHAGAAENCQRGGESRGVQAENETPEQRQLQHPVMPAQARRRIAQIQTPTPERPGHQRRTQPAPRANEITGGEHRQGQPRQILPRLRERADHLRHHVAEQKNHNADRHQPDHARIDERGENLAAQVIAFLDVIGQPFHHLRQIAGLFASGNQRAVNLGKVPWPRRQRFRQTHAAAHIGAHGAEGLGDVLFLGLLDCGAQCGFQWQTGTEQARQLPRGPGEVVVGESGAEQTAAVSGDVAFLVHRQRCQATSAQGTERCALAVGLKVPELDFPGGIRRFKAIAIHQASRVTRRISSGAVAPLRIQRSPSSRRLNIPAFDAAARKACSPAPW